MHKTKALPASAASTTTTTGADVERVDYGWQASLIATLLPSLDIKSAPTIV